MCFGWPVNRDAHLITGCYLNAHTKYDICHKEGNGEVEVDKVVHGRKQLLAGGKRKKYLTSTIHE